MIRNGNAVGGGSQVNVDLCFAPTLPSVRAKISAWRKEGRIGPATDKMGRNPADSVVSTDFHVWGIGNLYVVDGSVFPSSIGANPMQSIYTFAKIFADRMEKVK